MSQTLRPEAYGEALSEVYDAMYPPGEAADIVAFIASLTKPGARVVEFGVGTGRVAIPAARQGFEVHGIEVSEAMLRKLRERDPDGSVSTVLADFSEHVVDDKFDLCYVVCNTLFMLPDPERQLRALIRAREHLVDGGTLLVEVYEPSRFHRLEQPLLQARHLAADKLMIDTVTVDRVNQVMIQIHTLIQPGAVSTYTELSRYAWPRELDLMARLAGLEPVGRWGDWHRGPFDAGSYRHISVYRRP